MDEIEKENQTLVQKKISFAQSEHLEAVLALLRESAGQPKLVGDTEFETIKNAITLDAQSELIIKFISAIDSIKKGSLTRTEL